MGLGSAGRMKDHKTSSLGPGGSLFIPFFPWDSPEWGCQVNLATDGGETVWLDHLLCKALETVALAAEDFGQGPFWGAGNRVP